MSTAFLVLHLLFVTCRAADPPQGTGSTDEEPQGTGSTDENPQETDPTQDLSDPNKPFLTDDIKEKYKKEFNEKRKEKISLGEVKDILAKHEVSDAYVNGKIEKHCPGATEVTFDQFLKLTPEKSEDESRELFIRYSRNYFLDKDGLKTLLASIGQNVDDTYAAEMIEEADDDEDKRLNYKEFMGVVLQHLKQ